MESDWEYQRWYVVIHRGCHKGCIHMLCHSFVKLWNWVASQLAWRQYRSLSLPLPLTVSPVPSKAFFWRGRTTNVALIGSHHLCAALFLPLPAVEAVVYYGLFFSPDEAVENGSEVSQACISHVCSCQLMFLAGEAGFTLEVVLFLALKLKYLQNQMAPLKVYCIESYWYGFN